MFSLRFAESACWLVELCRTEISIFRLINFIVVSANRRESVKEYPACLRKIRFFYCSTFQTELFLLSEAIFCESRLFFLRLMWYHYCSRHQSGCDRPGARFQKRACPLALSLTRQGIVYTSQTQKLIKKREE